MSKDFKPYVPAEKKIPEFTLAPIVLGVILGVVFGASSLYLVLKVGMTVSASIPVAVISVTIFRAFTSLLGLRPRTILENNMVQTVGSAGESIAFGVGVTMPAVLILGFNLHLSTVMLVAVLGGLLGVLMMIPLRRVLIVKEHGNLIYPEGTACAEVLKAGETGGTSAMTILGGFAVGFIYKIMNIGMHLWSEIPTRALGFFKGATVASEVSPELLGVGYIIGPRIASIMLAGGVLSFWVLIPIIKLFGDAIPGPVFPAVKPISQMGPMEIWKSYVLYIGAGAVAAGGIISLINSLPTIIGGARAGLSNVKGAGRQGQVARTDQDLPMWFVLLGGAVLVFAIWLAPGLHMNFLGALLIIVFGFLFVTVSSRLTGEIGSSSNPISGMTVATLLLTSLVFLVLGWVELPYRLIALCVAGIVCVAASNGGTTSQDLKTGYLVGATPKYQQIGLLIGAFTSALVIGWTLQVLNDTSTVYSAKSVPPGIRVNASALTETETPSARAAHADNVPVREYKVLWISDAKKASGPEAQLAPGKYLVDPDNGDVKYLVDPGINGTVTMRDDGVTQVRKYVAPKAALMSLIIDGILAQKLPWGLVLLGVALALVMELCGIASLPFAVGVYLPMFVSMPIFFGGLARWGVDRVHAKRSKGKGGEEDDSGPGQLYSSGLIAGGAIAGIAIAFVTGFAENFAKAIGIGHESELLAVIVFTAMFLSLVFVGLSRKSATGRK